MKDWNVVVTSAAPGRKERVLREELRQMGEFAPTGFRSVFLGRVADTARFLEELREARELMPETFGALGQVVPVEETHSFGPGELEAALLQAALPYAQRIGGSRFIVRVKRRGYKGVVSSLELEHQLADALFAQIQAQGQEPRIDFSDPDLVLVVELFPNRFGLGLLSRELRARYPFIKVK